MAVDLPFPLLPPAIATAREESLHQRTQAEFADSKQPRRDDCVEDSARREMQAAPKHPQIVIGSVQNNLSRFQCAAQRFQIEIAQRINNEIANRLDRHSERSRGCNAAARYGEARLSIL